MFPKSANWRRGALAVAALAVIFAGLWAYRSYRGPEENPSERQSDRALRYAVDYPTIGYGTRPPADAVARLQKQIDAGGLHLKYTRPRGYLDSLLAALGIDASSQMLVFSKTSVQARKISPKTPRALYFGDDTYVGWVPGASLIEIASLDPKLGFNFYTLDNSAPATPAFRRQMRRCLRCHDTYELRGGGVPRLLAGSGYIDPAGKLVSHEGWILVNDDTPIESRWGGWYVTGRPDRLRHLGNVIVKDPIQLQHLDELRVGNLKSLAGEFDTGPYLTGRSDIVALMVFEHQLHVQNLIVRVNYDTRTALHNEKQSKTLLGGDEQLSADTLARVRTIAEPLVKAMLMVGQPRLNGPVAGLSGFAAKFEALGPHDENGHSLRDLDLKTRLFRYPLSYVVYSDAFDALPAVTKRYIYRRFAEVLSGRDDSADFKNLLSPAERSAILEILTATKPDFAGALSAWRRGQGSAAATAH
jgi:hypothetical protein